MARTARTRLGLAALVVALTVAACSTPVEVPELPDDEHSVVEPAPEDTPAPGPRPTGVAYDLGDTTIVQERFAEDSPFRNLPVRLTGAIAAPDPAAGPAPVILVLHGAHAVCRNAEGGMVDEWPCDPEREQRNDLGLTWLVEELAAAGYVALAINTNAENTFGFGEVDMGDRTRDLVDLHLTALAEAAGAGRDDFGVDVSGADLSRLGILGHSRGGSEAVRLLAGLGLDPDAPGDRPYGPASGLLLLAPGVMTAAVEDLAVPLGVLLPACDGDMSHQDGQVYFETLREGAAPRTWAVSFWLDGGTHNGFNTALGPDMFAPENRADCDTTLDEATHHAALSGFATEFFGAVFAADPATRDGHLAVLGLSATDPAPEAVRGAAGRVAALPPGADTLTLLVPQGVDDVAAQIAAGAVTPDGVELVGCDPRYLVEADPLCRPMALTVAGQPARAVLDWAAPGVVHLALPDPDLSGYAAFTLRAAVDPLSDANPEGEAQALALRLTDGAGNTATLATRADEPALRYPLGAREANDWVAGGFGFTSPVFLTTVRIALADAAGVDLTDVRAVELVLDRPSGTLVVADLGFVASGG